MTNTVMLSFDIEEFDMPLEYGCSIPFEQQIEISVAGTNVILDLLRQFKIPATFFSTVVFATHAPAIIKRISADGHELASHGFFHSKFEESHLLESRNELEHLSGMKVTGFRMPRMMPVDQSAVQSAGYHYNSSLNPTYLPGRYNNFWQPRTRFSSNGILQLPASVTPIIRFPLFWLSFHNLPLWAYKAICKRTMSHDGYLNIYFHPWEFQELSKKHFGLPAYVSRISGEHMTQRFCSWVSWMKREGYNFSTISGFLG